MSEKGFTIIEILIAILVFFVGVVGVFSLITSSIRTTFFSVDNFTASLLAQEGMEIVRGMRDQNWLNLIDWKTNLDTCQTGCEIDYNDSIFSTYTARKLKIDSNGFYNYETGTDSKFQRKITITPDGETLKVKTEIFWGSGKSYKTQDIFYDWYNLGA